MAPEGKSFRRAKDRVILFRLPTIVLQFRFQTLDLLSQIQQFRLVG
jgi:hypothetical protein